MLSIMMMALTLTSTVEETVPTPRLWQSEEVTFVSRPRPYFPDRARTSEGEAWVICMITARGAFSRCWIESETPPGNEFGNAAAASMLQGARIQIPEEGPTEGEYLRAKIRFSKR